MTLTWVQVGSLHLCAPQTLFKWEQRGQGNRNTLKKRKENMRKSLWMRDFNNFHEDGKQMGNGHWSSRVERAKPEMCTEEELAAEIVSFCRAQPSGTPKSLYRERKEWAWGENISQKAANPATFKAGRRKKGQDSGICPRTSPVDICPCLIGQNYKTWPF